MKLRLSLAGAALLAALFTTFAALAVAEGQGAQPSYAPSVLTEGSAPLYLLRDEGGEVCVLSNGQPTIHTGIPVSSLPQADRLALREGITANSRSELSSLLEDLGS